MEQKPNKLAVGTTVGTTQRTVLHATLVNKGEPGDSFDRWIALCYKHDTRDRYVIWNIYDRPEGWTAAGGDYTNELDNAIKIYQKRGGTL